MPKQHTISATWFDTCYPDYVTDMSGIVVGIGRYGQTRAELVEQAVDEAYEDDDMPCGEHVHALLTEAIEVVVPDEGPNWRFWPVDDTGNEIRDPDAEIPDEQPSAWFRISIESEDLEISLRTTDNDDGSVMVDCADGGAAAYDQYIDGCTWESLENGSAYTILTDRPTLVAELTAEGYDVDCSEYSEPDEEDLRYWRAKYQVEGCDPNPTTSTREIMEWATLDDVPRCRRVSEQHWLVERAGVPLDAFHRACWDAGIPVDAEHWIRSIGV